MSCLYLLFLGLLLAITNDTTPAVACERGYMKLDEKCVDEDECENDLSICGPNAVCSNTVGSYNCQCVKGFETFSQAVSFTAEAGEECTDINECRQNKTICGPNAVCSNIPGSYNCTCDSGFVSSNGQTLFHASQNVTCNDIRKKCVDETLCAPDAQSQTTGVYCTHVESSAGQQHFNLTVLMLQSVIILILKFYQ